MKKTFPTPKPLDLLVRNAAGTIDVTAADAADQHRRGAPDRLPAESRPRRPSRPPSS